MSIGSPVENFDDRAANYSLFDPSPASHNDSIDNAATAQDGKLQERRRRCSNPSNGPQ